MGQEIQGVDFTSSDEARFQAQLEADTRRLEELESRSRLSSRPPVAGFEIEAWLVDDDMRPVPANQSFMARLPDSLASPELAKFNVELNNPPRPLREDALRRFHHDLTEIWRRADATAADIGVHLLMIGTLPTLRQSDLTLDNMSNLNRYRALNEQILKHRDKPLHLEITGHEHLECLHNDVMLEAGATSFQIHLQVPQDRAVALYNAAILASAATVAVGANSPYLFGKDLWAETRIPLFEQAIGIGGFGATTYGPLRRVGYGSDYARRSLSEVFRENLEHFPILLPIRFHEPSQRFAHLCFHNGTIWRWNRPLVGFDRDGTPHFRIEHRVCPAGPTLVDMTANAALYYGLAQSLSLEPAPVSFAQARDNFYLAAIHGLDAHIVWSNRRHWALRQLLLDELIPRAREGLQQLGIHRRDSEYYLDLVRQRTLTGQNGSQWQRGFVAAHGLDFTVMTQTYLNLQRQDQPVHTWPL
ncbi:MAG: glutamate-cysteine ligase family protein [Methylohalobius crimeensis]